MSAATVTVTALTAFLRFFVSRCYAPLVAVPAEAGAGREAAPRLPRVHGGGRGRGSGGGDGGELMNRQRKEEATDR